MKTSSILLIFIVLPLLYSCRSSRSMLKEIHPLKSSLYYELTSPLYEGMREHTVYMDFISYSNIDYYTSVKRKKVTIIPLLFFNYEGELFNLRLGEHSLTQLYREFLTEALLTECNSSTCFKLQDNQKGTILPDSAYRLEIKIRKNETTAKVKLNNSSFLWFQGEMVDVANNTLRPATSHLEISVRLSRQHECLLDKTYSTEWKQNRRKQSYGDSPSANAACLDDMTESLSMATKEIVEEISREMHLILSLQPKYRR